ncbi:MAG: quinone-dependent dihydroorotate dehydrogenase [Pseudomonadota bacterium]
MTVSRGMADLGARLMTRLAPEPAHNLTVKLLARGVGPSLPRSLAAASSLNVSVAGIDFPNPLGLAAGFDKNAEAYRAMLRAGFGFVEVGAVTPRPQPGNPRPRVFRLPEDRAVINRYGFNNDGVDRIAARLPKHRRGIVGVNLGANKDSDDRIEDYVTTLKRLDGRADFFTINISSPNTPGLRALQGKAALDDLLARAVAARAAMTAPAPLFLKIAPDLTDGDKADIAASLLASEIDGLIVSNTTLARPETLAGADAAEKGGLSGAPLFAPSTALLREFYQSINGARPIIGVGGVSSGDDAYEKILAGASLVQLYTALIYEGPGLIGRILKDLVDLAQADGFASIADAVGARA